MSIPLTPLMSKAALSHTPDSLPLSPQITVHDTADESRTAP